MKCKVKSKEMSRKLIEFPKLMISSNDMIVLFDQEESGIVLAESAICDDLGVGEYCEYCECFNMSFFQDFDGKVIVSND